MLLAREWTGRLRIAGWSAAALLLAAPLMAMQLTDAVSWSATDFAVFAALLAAVGLPLDLALRRTRNLAYLAGAAIALGAAFLLVWAALAVGVLGVEGDPADLLYVGVIAVGIAGAGLARFRAAGLARAMLVAAIAVAGVTAIALMLGKHQSPAASPGEILGLNALFVAALLTAAGLFRAAAREAAG